MACASPASTSHARHGPHGESGADRASCPPAPAVSREPAEARGKETKRSRKTGWNSRQAAEGRRPRPRARHSRLPARLRPSPNHTAAASTRAPGGAFIAGRRDRSWCRRPSLLGARPMLGQREVPMAALGSERQLGRAALDVPEAAPVGCGDRESRGLGLRWGPGPCPRARAPYPSCSPAPTREGRRRSKEAQVPGHEHAAHGTQIGLAVVVDEAHAAGNARPMQYSSPSLGERRAEQASRVGTASRLPSPRAPTR